MLNSSCISARYNIDIHDYSVRLKAARKFLKTGDKVIRILCKFAGMFSVAYFLILFFSG
jgi:translation initiation factor IF-3